MKKQIKKLQLNRDTLTSLANVQENNLRHVDGGAAPQTYKCTDIQSVCWCYT